MSNMIPWLSRYMAAVQSMIADEFDRALADTDLRGVQLLYLFCVCENPSLSQEGLSQQLGVNGSNVTRQLGALERLGYISRRRNPEDGRQWLVEPTDRAYDLLPRMVEIMSDVQERLTRGMSYEEQELLSELLDRLSKNAARREAELRRKNR
ncbi:MAG: MarR family transcriptional regulator [Clostridia bacterium]|nr:MarR family transcriptional regulator [Clostridia bacterium]